MRKTKLVTIDPSDENRDAGKTFLITEMAAWECERWAARALLALGRAGVEISDDTMAAGAVAVLGAGLAAFRQMRFEDAEPLLDEMMACVSFVPDLSRINPLTTQPFARKLQRGDDANASDIEELSTLLRLRMEVIELHTGFSVAGALSELGQSAKARGFPNNTRTSRKSAAGSSAKNSRRSTNSKRNTA